MIPPRYENATDEDGDPVVISVDDIVTPPPIVVVRDDDGDSGKETINFVIPSDMRVTQEPFEKVNLEQNNLKILSS